jgi:hypothetical protein
MGRKLTFVTSASNSHSQTLRSPEFIPLSSSLSRSQSPGFVSPIHTPACNHPTRFSSVPCTSSLWGIVCFETHFLWAFTCLTHNAFRLFLACTVAIFEPTVTFCPPLDPAIFLILWCLSLNTCCALPLKPALCLPSVHYKIIVSLTALSNSQ